jgi:hypothetical protein
LVVLECVARIEWGLRSEVPITSPNLYYYYPELKEVLEADIEKGNNRVDVLLLGGSALHEAWGNIGRLLLEKLTYALKDTVNLYNLAKPGHTSLDSYYKYNRLLEKHFDLVIYYHGINDLRLNNCPAAMYKNDYSHYAWYKVVNRFEKGGQIPNLASIFALYYRLVRLEEKLGSPPKYIPKKRLSDGWMKHGAAIKSEKSFRTNVERILDIAQTKEESVVLMTFCYYVPDDYSLKRFDEKTLDYSLHDSAIEIWGYPENIVNGLEKHNKILHDVADRFDTVVFIDQNGVFPKRGAYFNDICHFTQQGCEQFVDRIMKVIVGPGGHWLRKDHALGQGSSVPLRT